MPMPLRLLIANLSAAALLGSCSFLANIDRRDIEQFQDEFATQIDDVQDMIEDRLVPPFGVPASGYLGLQYLAPYDDNRGLHHGIDIWAAPERANGGQRGNAVFAVESGRLGRTGSGVEICHETLDAQRWPFLPNHSVCTYYGHLADLPDHIAEAGFDSCPRGLVEVERGELLGYMDHTDMVSNSGIVHLHFSVVNQAANGCWTSELSQANTLDPMLYLGLRGSDYDWWTEFP